MLRLNCPFCGLRDEIEFHCGGQAHIERPSAPMTLTDEAWADYLFMRNNPKGRLAERWLHAAGCRRWFNVVRDTVSHRIVSVYRSGQAPPPDGEQ